jgi:predicted amidohydrolase
VAFPELSLTGYELDAEAVSPSGEGLIPIVEACAETGTMALVGAPVAGEHGRVHIATLCVGATGVEIVYRKIYLGGDEPMRFSPGDAPVALEVDGWRLGLGICKDTKIGQHAADTAALGIDAYVAGLVHLPDELPMQDTRGAAIARTYAVNVIFASFAGSTGGGFARTAGSSTIWSRDGSVLARTGPHVGGMAKASIT